MPEKLKSCPFCGGEAELCGADNPGHEYWVRCKRNCTPLTMERDRAIREWNTRHRHEQTAQAIAEAVEALTETLSDSPGYFKATDDNWEKCQSALAKLRAIQEGGE